MENTRSLKINLTKDVQNIYVENYSTLLKGSKKTKHSNTMFMDRKIQYRKVVTSPQIVLQIYYFSNQVLTEFFTHKAKKRLVAKSYKSIRKTNNPIEKFSKPQTGICVFHRKHKWPIKFMKIYLTLLVEREMQIKPQITISCPLVWKHF